MSITCTNCGRSYPAQGAPHRCPHCGGLFGWSDFPAYDPAQLDYTQPGLWRYRHTFTMLPPQTPAVSLGEGLTPLVWAEAFGRQVAFKCEFANPSGSFKDRGMTTLVTFLRSRGMQAAVEDSSGNAGASFGAYAARAGMRAEVFVPAEASGPKLEQARRYGALLHPVSGSRAEVSLALEKHLQTAPSNLAYASHAWMPQNLPGYATAAYEIFEQLGQEPALVLCPVGQGGLFLGLHYGFESLHRAGLLQKPPLLIGVQARACAPLWTLANAGYSAYGLLTEGPTAAEGIRIRAPLRLPQLMQLLEQGQADFVAVDEAALLQGRDQLARRGLYVEPTSAVVWPALEQALQSAQGPVVAVLTGSGLKTR